MAAVADKTSIYGMSSPIGYQPLMRCSQQHGYMLLQKEEREFNDLYLDPRFEALRFRLTPELCQWIYGLKEGGDQIYPKGDIPGFDAYLSQINEALVFSREAFDRAATDCSVRVSKRGEVLKDLREMGIQVVEEQRYLPSDVVDAVNKEYTIERASKEYGVEPKLYLRFSI